MLRKIHKILILLAIGTHITFANHYDQYSTPELYTMGQVSFWIVVVLVGIWVVDILFNIVSYIVGTFKGITNDTVKTPLINILTDIFRS